ncbi:hypothetical protein [Dokdonia sp. Hel_I_53]|uniref:hypothetical protein n=1 Tax=Dokdonia sp. Hel_I_53 TaxID=1566287 RepID=UPI00119C3AF5|nr:hypothetical protein [Dokdonia sp. Hel_I_53]TVZ51655.1 hypothetical protein OD90_0803 [Dokdonia sp. Hel_I_53]
MSFCLIVISMISCNDDDPSSNSNESTIGNEANQQPLGTSASQLLASDTFTSARVEIAYVEGSRPTQETIDLMIPFLEQRLNKPDGITIVQSVISIDQEAPYDINEIVAIEESNRTVFNNGDEIGIWILFADGNSESDSGNSVVLGTAYRNTSMVLFEKTFRDLESTNILNGDRTVIETATLRHEFGHLFGLVNTGTPLTSDHEDEANERHCEVEDCLMYFQTVTSVFDTSGVDNIPDFDSFCIADLQANGGM